MFGLGVVPNFRELLITKLSPHLSAPAFQYWLQNGPNAFKGSIPESQLQLSHSRNTLNDAKPKKPRTLLQTSSETFYTRTGRSRYDLNLIRKIFSLLNLKKEVSYLLSAQILAEQREIWSRSLRRVFLSRLLSWWIGVLGKDRWLWGVLGVPRPQIDLIERDYECNDKAPSRAILGAMEPNEKGVPKPKWSGAAFHAYALATLDPVIRNTLLSRDNPYYLLPLLGHYTPQSCPAYLTAQAYNRLSRSSAFKGLRIHTDEVVEVLECVKPGSLSVIVLMDSLDWIANDEAGQKWMAGFVKILGRSLRPGGRGLLRSAGLRPWYVDIMERCGLTMKCVGSRERSSAAEGICVDR